MCACVLTCLCACLCACVGVWVYDNVCFFVLPTADADRKLVLIPQCKLTIVNEIHCHTGYLLVLV